MHDNIISLLWNFWIFEMFIFPDRLDIWSTFQLPSLFCSTHHFEPFSGFVLVIWVQMAQFSLAHWLHLNANINFVVWKFNWKGNSMRNQNQFGIQIKCQPTNQPNNQPSTRLTFLWNYLMNISILRESKSIYFRWFVFLNWSLHENHFCFLKFGLDAVDAQK